MIESDDIISKDIKEINMKKRYILILLLVLLFVNCYADIEKFSVNKVSFGMSLNEVRKIVGKSTLAAKGQLEKNDKIADIPCKIVYLFDGDGKLWEIHITFESKNRSIKNDFNKLDSLLIEKYGEPPLKNDNVADKDLYCMWMRKDSIDIQIGVSTNNNVYIVYFYNIAHSQDKEKL